VAKRRSLALALVFLAALGSPTAIRAGPGAGPLRAKRIELFLSGIRFFDDDLRQTYGTVPCAGLALDVDLSPDASICASVGYGRREGDPYHDPTFVRDDAAELTIIPLRLALRGRAPREGPWRFRFGMGIEMAKLEERLPAEFLYRDRGEVRRTRTFLGFPMFLGPEWTTPFHKWNAGLELTLSAPAFARRSNGGWDELSGYSARISLAAPL
jgi:hypothetical protein